MLDQIEAVLTPLVQGHSSALNLETLMLVGQMAIVAFTLGVIGFTVRVLNKNSTRHVPEGVRQDVFQRATDRCERCGKETDELLLAYVIVPTDGGSSEDDRNVQAVCRKCL